MSTPSPALASTADAHPCIACSAVTLPCLIAAAVREPAACIELRHPSAQIRKIGIFPFDGRRRACVADSAGPDSIPRH